MPKLDFLKLAKRAAKIADSKKALDTIILDVRELTTTTNFFVITTAQSSPQINAVISGIDKTFKEDGIMSLRKEGSANVAWKVLDYGGLIIHAMSCDIRQLYHLEALWKDAKILTFSDEKIKPAEITNLKTLKTKKKSLKVPKQKNKAVPAKHLPKKSKPTKEV
ncbi:MAG: ribosome silencing factor [Elusimicrobiota bacterium]|jgi:ribosome-associated protein|nr:ribosome silencing factor [Elusimicrobiota bacterium]